ncbi:MAG: tRNA lysidine(34) synthetase TilS [Eubacterium sp.]|nr:tRNA lysidine(34) synthetase TilS [Eubacterium sp.]
MVSPGCLVIAGVSGGADSLCLLLVLLKLREVFGYKVCVVHVEHGIRGEASMRDAEFVRHFCAQRGIECHICHCHVPEYARAHRMGEEEAGRRLRYDAFRQEKEKYPGREVKIAVAHHLGDNAETMLFHLARGTGIRGLLAIAPVNGDLIRPLLCVGRAEIEAYLKGCGQDYCEDATNGMDVYSRNRLRHHALLALHQVNSRAQEHMYETACQLRELYDYLEVQAEAACKKCCKPDAHGVVIEKEPFLRERQVIQTEMLCRLLRTLAKSGRDFTRGHIVSLTELFEKQNGRQVHLPYGIKAERVYAGIRLVREDAEKEGGRIGDTGKNQFTFRLLEGNSDQMSQISKKKYTKCFDYDKIKNGFCVRNRQPGDYLVVDASGSRQKLKKYLVNEKIPSKERERLLLLADGDHIMWVVGYRISSYYKVDEHTRNILEVTFYGGREDEGTDSGNDFRGRGKCTDCRDRGADQ